MEERQYGLLDAKGEKISLKLKHTSKPLNINLPKEIKGLLEDKSIYEYDDLYDDIKQKVDEEKSQKIAESRSNIPKYMGKLLEAAKRRQIQHEKWQESRIAKEREAEGDQFKDKEIFITSTYKQQMDDIALKRQQETQAENAEKKERENMTYFKFYNNIYKQRYGEILDNKESHKLIEKPNEKNDNPTQPNNNIIIDEVKNSNATNMDTSPKTVKEKDKNSPIVMTPEKTSENEYQVPEYDSSEEEGRRKHVNLRYGLNIPEGYVNKLAPDVDYAMQKRSLSRTPSPEFRSPIRDKKSHNKKSKKSKHTHTPQHYHKHDKREKTSRKERYRSRSPFQDSKRNQDKRKIKTHTESTKHNKHSRHKIDDRHRTTHSKSRTPVKRQHPDDYERKTYAKEHSREPLNERNIVKHNSKSSYNSNKKRYPTNSNPTRHTTTDEDDDSEVERETQREKELARERLITIFARRNVDPEAIKEKRQAYLQRLKSVQLRGGLDPGFESLNVSSVTNTIEFGVIQKAFEMENDGMPLLPCS